MRFSGMWQALAPLRMLRELRLPHVCFTPEDVALVSTLITTSLSRLHVGKFVRRVELWSAAKRDLSHMSIFMREKRDFSN